MVLLWFQIYPYLVLNDSQVTQCRSQERVLQLFSMVNLFLDKDKVRTVIVTFYYTFQKKKSMKES